MVGASRALGVEEGARLGLGVEEPHNPPGALFNEVNGADKERGERPHREARPEARDGGKLIPVAPFGDPLPRVRRRAMPLSHINEAERPPALADDALENGVVGLDLDQRGRAVPASMSDEEVEAIRPAQNAFSSRAYGQLQPWSREGKPCPKDRLKRGPKND